MISLTLGTTSTMVFALSIFFGTLTTLILWGRKSNDWKTNLTLQAGWVIKCLASTAFFYVYSEIYGNGKLAEDPGAYFDEAKVLTYIYKDNPNDYYNIIFNRYDFEQTIAQAFEETKNSRIGPSTFGINETRNQIKLISALILIIGENTMNVFAFFVLLSFLGLLVLWKALKAKASMQQYLIFLLLLLPVSLLFWTSSILKECTSIFGLSLLLAYFVQPRKSFLWNGIGVSGFLFVLLFKPILILLLFISWLIFFFYTKLIHQKKWKYLFILLPIGVLFVYFSIPQKALYRLSDKQFDFVNVARGGVSMEGDSCYYFLEKINRDKIEIIGESVHLKEPVEMIAIQSGKIRRETKFLLQPGTENLRFEFEQHGGNSYFEIRPIDRSWIKLLLSIPESLLNGLFRPFAWSHFLSFQNVLLFSENLFFIYLTILVVKQKRKSTYIRTRKLTNILLTFSALYVVIIGLTSPISGAIVRYRIPIHLIILFSFIITRQKHATKQ